MACRHKHLSSGIAKLGPQGDTGWRTPRTAKRRAMVESHHPNGEEDAELPAVRTLHTPPHGLNDHIREAPHPPHADPRGRGPSRRGSHPGPRTVTRCLPSSERFSKRPGRSFQGLNSISLAA